MRHGSQQGRLRATQRNVNEPISGFSQQRLSRRHGGSRNQQRVFVRVVNFNVFALRGHHLFAR